MLLTNNENCGTTNPARVGGMSLYDVSDPTAITELAIGKGDTNNNTRPRATGPQRLRLAGRQARVRDHRG